MQIAPVPPGHSDARYCLDRYFEELRERFDQGFDPQASAAPSLDAFTLPAGLFLVAYADGRPVGCGGFKRLDAATAYLKRMWVDPATRGIGLGSRLLAQLEGAAHIAGYRRVALDTHRSLIEACALYGRRGYRPSPPLADERYADHWFLKDLAPPT